MSDITYVVQISNQPIVVRASQPSFGTVRVTPAIIGQVRISGGVPGPPGQAGSGVNFTQSSPSNTWIINHNLGFRPSVALFTIGGMEILGEIVHTSVNQTVVNFNGAIAGFARLT